MNVRLALDDDVSKAPVRARVMNIESAGYRVLVAATNEEHVVPSENIEYVVTLPWKPSDLSNYFIIFRRKLGRNEEYINDLLVRRELIKEILSLLTEKGYVS